MTDNENNENKIHNILIIDDQEMVLDYLEAFIKQTGHTIFRAENGQEAIALIKETQFSLIISDYMMPGLSGLDVLVKAKEIWEPTTRILLTAAADTRIAIDAVNSGCVHQFLEKPIKGDLLRQIILDGLEKYEIRLENIKLNEIVQEQNDKLLKLNTILNKQVINKTNEVTNLNHKMKESFLSSIHAIADIAEMYSFVIGSHGKRVSSLASQMGEILGLDETEIFKIVVAAVLHDVGKIGIPKEVLLKPSVQLAHHEKKMIEIHAEKGEAIVRKVIDDIDISNYVRWHHERLDGSGYPDKLEGDQIPLGARILAVADSFDFGVNKEVYYDPKAPFTVLEIIENSHNLFDHEVVNALRRVLTDKNYTWTDATEMEVRLRDLKPNMILSRDLKTLKGKLLLPADSILSKISIERIKNFIELDPVMDGIFVKRLEADEEIVGSPNLRILRPRE